MISFLNRLITNTTRYKIFRCKMSSASGNETVKDICFTKYDQQRLKIIGNLSFCKINRRHMFIIESYVYNLFNFKTSEQIYQV